MNHDCIIIGAGMSGLAAGIRMAMFDHKTVILEKHYTAGGLNSYYSMGGRLFDVGLHAMTNYVPRGTRGAPLTKLLRQLRIAHEALGLEEQLGSRIAFPGVSLKFTNDIQVLRDEVAARFPGDAAGFDRLVEMIRAAEMATLTVDARPTRPILREYLGDPLLIEMLLCPLMYYGSAREDEIDFDQFIILFHSIYLQGFARPPEGVRRIVKLLTKKFTDLGGELRMQTGVNRLRTTGGRITGVELATGEVLKSDCILSSIGHLETLQLCGEAPDAAAGQLSFTESISCLDCEPASLGITETIIFFNDAQKFDYRRPTVPVDVRSGVICMPNNYHNHHLKEGLVRVTNIADPHWWLDPAHAEAYPAAKAEWHAKSLETVAKFVPDFRAYVTYTDMFTPRSILQYTGHRNGAVYGAPHKIKDGATPYENLYLCGTDQGFLGIVGAMLSGVSIANLHGLKKTLR